MINQQRPRVLTGLRANSNLTLANYLGAVLPMAELAQKHKDTHDFFMFVPDLHSFITPIDHSELYANTLQNVKFYVAAGAVNLKNDNLYIYRQSHVPAHSELSWILDCFTYMGELSRMTQFKEKAGLSLELEQEEEILETLKRHTNNLKDKIVNTVLDRDLKKVMQELKHESINVGLFNYPVLMAADILLYGATYVPVGDDQKQHLELTRDVAMRMNERFKDVFEAGVFERIPATWKDQLAFSNRDQGLRIRSLRTPTSKMSKSDADEGGFIALLDSPGKAAKKVMAATTDSLQNIKFDWDNQPGIANLLQMLALLSRRNLKEVVADWEGKTSYGDLKNAVAKEVGDFLTKFQEKLTSIDDTALLQRLENDEARARDIANAQLRRVQQAVGLYPRS